MSVVKVYCKIETSPWALTQLIGGGKEEKKQWTMFLFAFKYDTAPVADPADLELRGVGGGGVGLGCWNKIDLRISLALPAFLPSAFFHYFIFCQNKGGPGPPGPAPRSTTGHKEEEIWSSLWNKYKTIGLVFGTWSIFKNQRFSFGPKMGSSLAHRQKDHYLIMAYLTGTCYSSSRTYL